MGSMARLRRRTSGSEAEDRSHEQVVSVVVCRRSGVRCDLVLVISRADRQRVADENPAGRRLPGRGQDIRARLVDSHRGVVDPEGPEPRASGLPVEQAAEYARRVEAGHAEPVDRPIRGHERAGVAVRQEPIIGYRAGTVRVQPRSARGAPWLFCAQTPCSCSRSCRHPESVSLKGYCRSPKRPRSLFDLGHLVIG